MKFRYAVAVAAMLCLTLMSCGFTKKVGNSVKDVLGGRPDKTLTTHRISFFELDDKLRGGWAGKMIGVSYGSPYEFKNSGEINQDPLEIWIPQIVNRALEKHDLYVNATFLEALRDKGMAITTAEAAPFFLRKDFPLSHANLISRDNLRSGVPAQEAGHPRNNPHYSDTDFLSESDVFGLATPGMPQITFAFADVFGDLVSYSHGFYAGAFTSSMYSAAYFEQDRVQVVRQGLANIHPNSQIASVVQSVLRFYEENPEDWQACWDMLQQRWGDVQECPEGSGQANNYDARINTGFITLGLLYGGGDFARTLEITTRCGQDTDTNAGVAAGVLGTIIGYGQIPSNFTSGIPIVSNQSFLGTEYNFDRLVQETKRMAEEVIRRYGGTIERLGMREYYSVPIQSTRTPRRFER